MPWATVFATIAAIVVYFTPSLAARLLYQRGLVQEGQWWRLVTGSWVHFTPGQLIWNLAILIPAGVWAESVRPAQARWLYLFAPLLGGAALFSLVPQVAEYSGLSGLAAGMVAFLAIAQLQSADPDRWFWRAVLGLLALKVAAEMVIASPLVSHVPDPTSRAAPLSHLSGIVAALVVARRRRRTGP